MRSLTTRNMHSPTPTCHSPIYKLSNARISESYPTKLKIFVLASTHTKHKQHQLLDIIRAFSKIQAVCYRAISRALWKRVHRIHRIYSPNSYNYFLTTKREITSRHKASINSFSPNSQIITIPKLHNKIWQIRKNKLEVMQRNIINAAKVNNFRYIEKAGNRLSKEDINGADCYNNTALYYASMLSKINALRSLLKHGANPNSVNENGNTPLHQAFRANNIQTVSTLLTNGADPKLENYYHQTPIYFASKKMVHDLGLNKWACLTIIGNNLDELIGKKTIAEPQDYKLELLEKDNDTLRNIRIVQLSNKHNQHHSIISTSREKSVDIPLYINSILRKADVDLFKATSKL